MAVGSNGHVKAEIYKFGTGAWSQVDDYPFSMGVRVNSYEMLYIDEISAYLVIGGNYGDKTGDNVEPDQYSSLIAVFKNGAWSEGGELNEHRTVSLTWLFFLI